MIERRIRAQFLRVGTQLLTPDGWQNITGMLVFQEDDQSADQITVHTPERTIDNSDGWPFRFGEMVAVAPGGSDSTRTSWYGPWIMVAQPPRRAHRDARTSDPTPLASATLVTSRDVVISTSAWG